MSNQSEKHALFQTKMVKIYTLFRQELLKTHTIWGLTYLYSSHGGLAPASSPYRSCFNIFFVVSAALNET